MLRLSPGGLTARKIFIVALLHYRDPEFHRAEIAVPGGRGAMNGAPGPALRYKHMRISLHCVDQNL
jgi:hypothetical protein